MPLPQEPQPGLPYPVAALGPLQAVVNAVQGMTQAPVALPAQSALAVASLAVQGFANVETLGGDRPLAIYALTVAGSGERKSTCDKLLMRGLRDFEREQAAVYRQALKSWKAACHALWKALHDAIVASVRGNAGKASQLEAEADLAALGDEPVAPPQPDRTVTEPTYEGLTRKFAEGMPSLGIFSDEGGQFLGGFAMSRDHRQKTLAALNDLWQGNPIRRTRQGDGSLTLHDRRLAIHLMVQPGVARDFMADPRVSDTGFLPRFLVCEPPSTIGTRLHALARDGTEALAAFNVRLGVILRTPLPMEAESRALQPRRLALSPEARADLIRFADECELRQAPGGELSSVTGHASKAAEHACRIAGVLTLWRDLDAASVALEDMACGIELARYYLSEAVRLASAETIREETERAECLRHRLVDVWRHDQIMTREVAQQAPTRPLRENAVAALRLLERHGWVVALPEGTVVRGSPRSTAWQIVKVREEA
ncbi:hypothetical protein HNP73_003367 [Amaricoccus macauensis]|uniref:DUF3987 domain-containing protein n=1 Tax=Amaricoccus macauensis TaxID=57001 RepID=A0A840SRM4_9RHOB|nr:YfjI family protein [Amaricoccus macauensis]MBB5223420.1 hypothetical protein [Amaricoccus macauensis]